MQPISINSQIVQNTSNEACLDTVMPNELLKIIFDQVINPNQSLRDISSILLTCHKWKGILEDNPCIAVVQNLFQLRNSPQTVIKHPLDCRTSKQKKCFTQEVKLIDRVPRWAFDRLLMLSSRLFRPNSLFLPLLDRYPWDPEICQHSINKNIQQIAKKQLAILSSLASGTDDQIFTVIKNEKLYYGCIGEKRAKAEKSIIFKLKNFSNFKYQEMFIEIVGYFRKCPNIFLAVVRQSTLALRYADKILKKDREFVLAAVKQDGCAIRYADETLKKDKAIVLAAIHQNGLALQYADESLQQDRELFTAAVESLFQEDRELFMADVQQNDLALAYADESLQEDGEILIPGDF